MAENYSATERDLLRRVGGILRQHRRRCGLTQEQTAEKACLNVTYLSDVECGKRNVSLINLARLAHAFALPLEDIFTIKPLEKEDKTKVGSRLAARKRR